MGWTSNYALCPADSLLVRTSVRMTLSAPPNALAFDGSPTKNPNHNKPRLLSTMHTPTG